VPIAEDRPPDAELFGDFYDARLEEDAESAPSGSGLKVGV
jgi:hypothetical protein